MRKTAYLIAGLCLLAAATSRADFSPTNLPSLLLWYDADDATTVTKDAGNNVTQWKDKSGTTNNASSGAGPRYVPGALNGRAVLQFSGANVMTLTRGISLSTNSTAFFLADLQDVGRGILADPSVNRGWSYGIDGAYVLGAGKLFPGGAAGAYSFAQNWRVDGTPSLTFTVGAFHDFLGYNCPVTGSFSPQIGSGHGSLNKLIGNLGEVLVYDRTLTDPERLSVEQYLSNKWFVVSVPTAYPDFAGTDWATPITINVLTNDSGLAPLGLAAVTQPTNSANQAAGSAIITNAGTALTFSPQSGSYGQHTLYYQVTNSSGSAWGQVTVYVSAGLPFSVPPASLRLWFDADDAASVSQDVTHAVSQWKDKSGYDNHGTAAGLSRPLCVATSLNARTVLQFDGSNSVLSLGQTFVFSTNTTAFFVARLDGDGTKGRGLLADNGLNRGWDYDDNSSFVATPGVLFSGGAGGTYSFAQNWRVDSTQTLSYAKGGYHILQGYNCPVAGAATLTKVGGGHGSLVSFMGNLAELIVLDAPLSDPQRISVETYLHLKWLKAAVPRGTLIQLR